MTFDFIIRYFLDEDDEEMIDTTRNQNKGIQHQEHPPKQEAQNNESISKCSKIIICNV